jgi:phage FluMu protein gp41
MATVKFELIDGLHTGEGDQLVVHKSVTLRTLTAGDLQDAAIDAERLLQIRGEPVIVVSPTRMSNEVLRRQILRVGEIAGPLQDVLFRKLSAADLELIQGKAEDLDHASRAAVEAALKRGRSAEPVAGS